MLSHGTDEPFLITRSSVLSRQQVYDEAMKLASAMIANNLKLGDRVCLQLGSAPETVIAKLACWFAGLPIYTFGIDPLPDFRKIVMDGIGAKYLLTPLRYRLLMNGDAGFVEDFPKPQGSDILSIRRTSGTTGVSKIILDICEKRLSSALWHATKSGAIPGEKLLFQCRQNVGTSNTGILSAVTSGCALVHWDADTESMKEVIETCKPTLLIAPPEKNYDGGYQRFLEEMSLIDLSSVKHCWAFGYVREEWARQIDAMFVNGTFTISYGLTESAISLLCDSSDPLEKRMTTVGTGYDPEIIRIVDGELQIRKTYTSPFLDEAKYLSQITDDGEWFKTRDGVYIDDDGYYVITGRFEE